MAFPHFLDIEFSSPDEGGFPTSIAWSLDDGTIKTVFIAPDDSWDPWDNAGPDVDLQHLYDQGEAATDVIRELNMDLSGKTVFVDGLDYDEELLALLFDTFEQDADFELSLAPSLFPSIELENLRSLQRDIVIDNQLDPTIAFDNVKSWLFLYDNHAT